MSCKDLNTVCEESLAVKTIGSQLLYVVAFMEGEVNIQQTKIQQQINKNNTSSFQILDVLRIFVPGALPPQKLHLQAYCFQTVLVTWSGS